MENHFRLMASLIGDPTRATILWSLLDGKAQTATELAIAAGTTPQNISMHLGKLSDASLIMVEKQGRHRYYKYARKDVAYAVEALASLIPPSITKSAYTTGNTSAVKHCRSCYDHMAGRIGVAMADSLLEQKIIADRENIFTVTAKGKNWFAALDISIEALKQNRRPLIRPCLDWSERRHHIAGSLGAALLDHMLAADWVRKSKNSRALIITAKGQKMFHEYFKLTV